MQKKISEGLLLIGFVIMVILPFPIWMIVGKFWDQENYEKREPAKWPEFDLAAVDTYPAQFESSFNDRIPFRNQLIRLNSGLEYFVFHHSSSDSVILGDDGWLFLKKNGDSDPLSDYRGSNLFTEQELLQITDNLLAARCSLEKEGIEFYLFIAPNKSRVYAEKMPDYYGKPQEQNRVSQLVDYLREHTDLQVVYPKEELVAAKEYMERQGEIIYYMTDTHWNSIGAYEGSSVLLNQLGVDMPDITDEGMRVNRTGFEVSDLADLLNLRKALMGNAFGYQVAGYDGHQMERDANEEMTIFRFTSKDSDERKLFVCGDSYQVLMGPYLGSQFAQTYMIHNSIFTKEILEKEDPDLFVYEVVERYLPRLLTFRME